MKKTTHLALQALLVLLHPVVVYFPTEILDPVWQPMATALKAAMSTFLAGLQLALGNAAHNSNPDGTPASASYDKSRASKSVKTTSSK